MMYQKELEDSLFTIDRGSCSSSSFSRCSLHCRLASSPVPKKPPLLLPEALSAPPVSSCKEVPSACALSSAKALQSAGATSHEQSAGAKHIKEWQGQFQPRHVQVVPQSSTSRQDSCNPLQLGTTGDLCAL